MKARLEDLRQILQSQLKAVPCVFIPAQDMITLKVQQAALYQTCEILRDDPLLQFQQLVDVCGVDYLTYGTSEWETEQTTKTGFSRAVGKKGEPTWDRPRFAVVYHLLSLAHNFRLRLRVFVETESVTVPSVVSIWPAANWFEREVFDLFGIAFQGHPNLARILTDYDFKGHPFRKDFPISGYVEMRYDAKAQKCVYEPVTIQPRTLVPKVIRKDARYVRPDGKESD